MIIIEIVCGLNGKVETIKGMNSGKLYRSPYASVQGYLEDIAAFCRVVFTVFHIFWVVMPTESETISRIGSIR